MKRLPVTFPSRNPQAGGGMLTIVATLGMLLVLVQGTMYYKSKGSAKFLGSEKNKVLAMQLAEAGVEENIADLGKRTVRVHGGMIDSVTYDGKHMGGGTFTTRLTTVATGSASDTVDLVSTGSIGGGTQMVRARMKLKNFMDTSRTPLVIVEPETTLAYTSHSVPETTITSTVQDPYAMPAVNATPAYAACMASAPHKCDVCHFPSGDYLKREVINISKSAINSHVTHHGDYVTTDGTCDIYKPKLTKTVWWHTVTDTTRSIVNHTTYDTAVSIDTLVKVQILSWK